MKWITPPECGGQIEEVSYASDGECAYRRVTDWSVADGHPDRETYSRVSWDILHDSGHLEWEPWNQEPSIPAELWERCASPREEVS